MRFGKLKQKVMESVGISIIDLNGHIKNSLDKSAPTSKFHRLMRKVDFTGGHKVFERLTDPGKELVFKIVDDETIKKYDPDKIVGLSEMKGIARKIEDRLNVEVPLKKYGKV
jgi:hypothetical protein